MKLFTTFFMLFISPFALADWHHGKIDMIAIGYDGKTVSIGQVGFTGKNCTCYSAWPNRFCLDPNRETFDKEYALILSAKARDKKVSINIDENSCKIRAIYEM